MNEKAILVANKTINQIVAEIKALKGTDVTSLDLGWNILWKKSTPELTAMIGAVEGTGITHINLEGNGFEKKSTEELITLFGALKKTGVTHLNLSLNGFKNKLAEELQAIFTAIPKNVTSVSFYYSELEAMDESQLLTIRNRFDQPDSIILYNAQDIKLEPSLQTNDAKAYHTLGFKTSAPTLQTNDANAYHRLDFKASVPTSSNERNISMMVLGGFIAAAGIAAVAIAFAVLNATTFGVAGLVVAGVGIATVMSGIGLFATGTNKNRQTTSDVSLAFSDSPVHP